MVSCGLVKINSALCKTLDDTASPAPDPAGWGFRAKASGKSELRRGA